MLNYDHFTIEEATALQLSMREQLVLKPLENPVRIIGGADISYNKFSTKVFAGIVILSYPEMELLSYSLYEGETTFPFVHNYLGFREVPSLLETWKQIPVKPDILVLDGQGITHPRKLGVASHFGILENHPTIGCAKSMMAAKLDEVGLEKFSSWPYYREGELLGYALRTKEKKIPVEPVYISPGNLITAEETFEIMKNCVGNYRIPEPTRLAHEYVNKFRLGELKAGFHIVDKPLTLF
ncbi:endonuclease V [Flavobacterium sp. 3HN19-14]|uniref:endonuclease V n=1 Tax=Flavobacterium sp. 3HN19-14 TaxID=3448133 RepID=UPI003EE11B97